MGSDYHDTLKAVAVAAVRKKVDGVQV